MAYRKTQIRTVLAILYYISTVWIGVIVMVHTIEVIIDGTLMLCAFLTATKGINLYNPIIQIIS
jgi:hypothetical protein